MTTTNTSGSGPPSGTGVPPVRNPSNSPTHPTTPHAERTPEAVATWLDGLVRVMRLPKREAEEIREELDSHVRERVRDLMLVGESEPKAIHHAISELGDAALLAQRYKHARAITTRRWIMTGATFAFASTALVLSTMTLSGSPMIPGRTTQTDNTAPPTAMRVDDDRVAETLAARVDLDKETTYHEFFEMIRDAAGASIVDSAYFDDLDLDESMGVSADAVSIEMVLTMLNRRDIHQPIVLRTIDGAVEITTQRQIDRAQTRLIAYDIEPLIDEGVDPDQLTELIISFVEPDHWYNNGGDLAGFQIVGYRLFIQAPPRFLPRIEWMLDQLSSDEDHASIPFLTDVPLLTDSR